MTKRLAQKILRVHKELESCDAMDALVCIGHRKEAAFIMDIVSETGKWWIHLIREAEEKLNERRNSK